MRGMPYGQTVNENWSGTQTLLRLGNPFKYTRPSPHEKRKTKNWPFMFRQVRVLCVNCTEKNPLYLETFSHLHPCLELRKALHLLTIGFPCISWTLSKYGTTQQSLCHWRFCLSSLQISVTVFFLLQLAVHHSTPNVEHFKFETTEFYIVSSVLGFEKFLYLVTQTSKPISE